MSFTTRVREYLLFRNPEREKERDRLTHISSLDAFILSNNFLVTDTPTTRVYHWRLSWAIGGVSLVCHFLDVMIYRKQPWCLAPDGFYRKMMVVNNLFPGPLIEANEGDTIIVHVKNDLDEGASIRMCSF